MGKGIFSHEELIDSMIVECNSSVHLMISGNYVGWCKMIVDIVQKLTTMKKGISDEIAGRDKRIEELKIMLKDVGVDVVDIPIEEFIKKGGADNGE